MSDERPDAGDESDALTVELSDRFLEAAARWGESRVMTESAAVEAKVEQALLEIEHLVSGAVDVEFELGEEETTVYYEPSDGLAAFLEAQGAETGLEPGRVLKLHVELFARAFLDEDTQRPDDRP
ncbi:hypothetical protein CV102_13075 [Natronococcus pandeyae]|uniref:Uncharacterized protein n=1 Tax=Natronococcus pandeyae TaxID=2055836 RepID=A0A8J8Q434_9EURY|nr:hypothetical protein [Natronococcus pandeyae]TYL38133.1 hypothetical protein CV102_13075 [Natronococcus pandeyae]